MIVDALIYAGIGAATGLTAYYFLGMKALGRTNTIVLCAVGGLVGGFLFNLMLSILKSIAPALAALAGGVFILLAASSPGKSSRSKPGKGKTN